MVVCFLFIVCLFKDATCNPCLSSLTNNKYPAMTTSYASSILPEDNDDFNSDIPSYNSYTYPDVPHEISYPSEDVQLNYQNLLSRPMAITRDAYNPELNILNDYYGFNNYNPRISATPTNLNFFDNPIFPRLTNDVHTPKYQCKPFFESYNSFLDNIYKVNELNFRNVPSPLSVLENSKSLNDISYTNVNDQSPLKISQENYSEYPICTSTLGNGPSYNKFNPFNSNTLNQQLFLNNQNVQENKMTKTDEDNLNRIDIDINIPSYNYDEKNIPLEIILNDPYDDIESIEEDGPYIIIDLYDVDTIYNNYNLSQQMKGHNTTKDLTKQTNQTNIINCTNAVKDPQSLLPFNLKEFSSYLADTIISALEAFLSQENSIDSNDCYSDNSLNCEGEDLNNSNSMPCNKPLILPKQPEVCSLLDTKSDILLNGIKSSSNLNYLHEAPKQPMQANSMPEKCRTINTPCSLVDISIPTSMSVNCTDDKNNNSTDIKPESYSTTYSKDNMPAVSSTNRTHIRPKSYTTNNTDNKAESYSTNRTENKPEEYSANRTDAKPQLKSMNNKYYKPESYSTNSTDDKPGAYSANETDRKPQPTSFNSKYNKPESYSTNSTDNRPGAYSANRTDIKSQPKLMNSKYNKTESYSTNSTDNKSGAYSINNKMNIPKTNCANTTSINSNSSLNNSIDSKPELYKNNNKTINKASNNIIKQLETPSCAITSINSNSSSVNSTDSEPGANSTNTLKTKPETSAVRNTNGKYESSILDNKNNKTEQTSLNSTNIKPKITNTTENIKVYPANTINNNDSSTQIYVKMDGSPLSDNNIDKISKTSKAQPRLSTITINLAPKQESHHQVLVFV